MKHLLSILLTVSVVAAPSIALAQFSTDSSLADKVVIFTSDGSGTGLVSTDGINRIVATGNFYYITPEQEVRGDKGVYTAATDSFDVTGDVVLLQQDSVVTGERLKYNLTTRAAEVAGDCNGRKCGKGRRVAILIRSTDSARGVN